MREKDELRSSLEASKKAHERETVLRVEAENALNATRQELAFVKDVHAAVSELDCWKLTSDRAR